MVLAFGFSILSRFSVFASFLRGFLRFLLPLHSGVDLLDVPVRAESIKAMLFVVFIFVLPMFWVEVVPVDDYSHHPLCT